MLFILGLYEYKKWLVAVLIVDWQLCSKFPHFAFLPGLLPAPQSAREAERIIERVDTLPPLPLLPSERQDLRVRALSALCVAQFSFFYASPVHLLASNSSVHLLEKIPVYYYETR